MDRWRPVTTVPCMLQQNTAMVPTYYRSMYLEWILSDPNYLEVLMNGNEKCIIGVHWYRDISN